MRIWVALQQQVQVKLLGVRHRIHLIKHQVQSHVLVAGLGLRVLGLGLGVAFAH